MYRKRAFTLIELVIAVAILGILSVMIIFNSGTARARSRDANRRVSIANYQASFEQYKSRNGTYFVHTGDCTAPTSTRSVGGVLAIMEATGTGCAGYYGGGAGRITRTLGSSQNLHYKTFSIAQALVKEGYLSQITTDPLDKSKSTSTYSDRDYIVTICDTDGSPALTPASAKEFAIYMSPEIAAKTVEEGTSKQLCGGPTTSHPWDYWLTDATEAPATRAFADIQPTTAPESTQTSLPQPSITNLTTVASSDLKSVEGSYVLKNTTTAPLGNTYYSATLIYSPKGGEQQEMVTRLITDFVTLRPLEEQTLSYSLAVPSGLAPGDYYVLIRGFSQTGVQVAAQAQPVRGLTQLDRMISITPSASGIAFGNTTYRPLEAVVAPVGVRPSLRFTLHNTHDFSITGSISIQIDARSVIPGQLPVRNVAQDPITINPGSAQPFQIAMPEGLGAESYLARVRFLDSDGTPISGYQDFRWVVAGEGGKIMSATASFTQHITNTTGQIRLSVIGAADRSTVTNARIIVETYRTNDPEKKSIGSSEQVIPLITSAEQSLTLSTHIKSGLKALGPVTTKITLKSSSGVVLHEIETAGVVISQRTITPLAWVIPLIMLIVLAIGGGIARRRSHRHYLSPISLILIPLLLLPQTYGFQKVHAQVAACVGAVQAGSASTCQAVWDANARPTVTVSQTFSTQTPTVGSDVTITTTINPDPVNNAVLTAAVHLGRQVAAVDPHCLDSVSLDIANVTMGVWVTTVTVPDAGTTTLQASATASSTSSCWETCGTSGSGSGSVTCISQGGTSTTTPTTTTPTTTTTTGTTTPTTTTTTTTGTTPTTTTTTTSGTSPLQFIGIGSNHF